MTNPVEYAKSNPLQAILVVAIVLILIMIYRDYSAAKAGLSMRHAGMKHMRHAGMKSDMNPAAPGQTIRFEAMQSHTGAVGTNAGFLGNMEAPVLYPLGNAADIYAQQQAASRAPEGYKAARVI